MSTHQLDTMSSQETCRNSCPCKLSLFGWIPKSHGYAVYVLRTYESWLPSLHGQELRHVSCELMVFNLQEMYIIHRHQLISKLICQYIHEPFLTDGLEQDCIISIANALEIPQFCTKPSIYLNGIQSQLTQDTKRTSSSRQNDIAMSF